MKRRQLLAGMGTTLVGQALPNIEKPPFVNRQVALRNALLRSDTLAHSAARLGILFGTAAEADVLYADDAYAQAVARECSVIVPEVSLKATVTRSKPDGFDFSRAERLYAFADSHGLAFRGHTLVWYQTIPIWVTSTISGKSQATTELLAEISEPCRHFRGRVDSWDVVNEVIDPNGQNDLRDSFWLRMIGPDYVPMALTAARQADPAAQLVLNENHIECDLPYQEKKRSALLSLLRTLRGNNVPIDAVGIESHLGDPDKFPFNPLVFSHFLDGIHELGIKVLITELDVLDRNMPADIVARDAAVAKVLGDFLTVVLQHPSVITVNVWGLSDRHSWISTALPRPDGLSVRPTLLDSNLMRKPAYAAVRSALDGTPKRA